MRCAVRVERVGGRRGRAVGLDVALLRAVVEARKILGVRELQPVLDGFGARACACAKKSSEQEGGGRGRRRSEENLR